MVATLIDQYPTRFAGVVMHINYDGLDTAWGQDRADGFYSLGGATPVLIYDGSEEWPAEDYEYGLEQRLDEPTDVVISLSAVPTGSAHYLVTASVCLEAGGTDKRVRVYAVQLLDHFPQTPEHSRNLLRKGAPAVDVNLTAGNCETVETDFALDPNCAVNLENVKFVVWAQEPRATGSAEVYQAAQIGWPFSTGEPAEPQLPRDVELPTPLFAGAGSAWVEDASATAVVAESDSQIQATYRAMCGDSTGLYPVDNPPTGDAPYPVFAVDDGSVPVFAAGSAQQSVLLCDYDGDRSFPNPKWNVDTEGGPVPVPACAGSVRPAGPAGTDSDGHLVLYDAASMTAYDFWQATTDRQGECQSRGAALVGTSILEAGDADFFVVNGAGANQRTVRSARPSGTPLLAGLLLPEDVEAGVIAHALAVAVPGVRNLSPSPTEPLASDVFYPASSTDTETYSVSSAALAAGQRLRLKDALVNGTGAPVNENSLDQVAPITGMVLAALRTHGAYVVGSAAGLTFFAEDIHTALLDLDDDQVNSLIGRAAGMPLATDMTRWQIVLERLNQDLAAIPFAFGSCSGSSSTVTTANFEVVEPATDPFACTPPSINSQSGALAVAIGDTATLAVAATGTEPLSYQWYSGESGDTGEPIDGATSASYTTPALYSNATFWARVSNDCGSVDSDSVAVIVLPLQPVSRYLIPAVAHSAGVGGTIWRTDVAVVNPGAAAASLELEFLPAAGGEALSASLSLPAGATVEWGNIMESVFGQSPDATASGSVMVESSTPLAILARTYNQTPEGTYGQNLPALAPGELLEEGAVGYLAGVKKNAAYRCNLGAINTGETTATVEARVFNLVGAEVGGPVSLTVEPGRWGQVNDLLGAAGAGNLDIAYATVTVAGSTIWAYASVVDNSSGDGTTVPLLLAPTAGTLVVPAIAHAPGVGGTLWRTDVAVVNPSSERAFLEVEFYPTASGETLSTSQPLDAGAALEWGNVMESVFAQSPDAVLSGSLELESSVPLVVVSRTYNQTPDGTFGQNLPGLAPGELLAPGVVGYLPGVKKNDAYRCNLGVVNTGEATAAVEALIFSSNGEQLGNPVTLSVEPGRWKQVNDLLGAAGAGSPDIAYATVVSTGAAVWAYASVVDNASGDGTTVPVVVCDQE